ncbi:hypothetical protein FOL47_001471 [Perkinsus chesapeaki]|uniref:Uncharacterized protein n=1 Tax=Perkinsus chesapeaki TaxID=330153 RepID=A0A7J6MJF0_PERCH|nr:hypothetical protein FOL47_001471 [Perkinsus chesapeaki]
MSSFDPGLEQPSAAGGYLADDENLLDDDLSFLQIAVTRMDSTLCEEMTNICRHVAGVLLIVMLLCWSWYSSSIRQFYAKYVSPNYTLIEYSEDEDGDGESDTTDDTPED